MSESHLKIKQDFSIRQRSGQGNPTFVGHYPVQTSHLHYTGCKHLPNKPEIVSLKIQDYFQETVDVNLPRSQHKIGELQMQKSNKFLPFAISNCITCKLKKLRGSVPSKSIIGRESCSKKVAVSLTQSTAGVPLRGGVDKAAEMWNWRRLIVRAWSGAGVELRGRMSAIGITEWYKWSGFFNCCGTNSKGILMYSCRNIAKLPYALHLITFNTNFRLRILWGY